MSTPELNEGVQHAPLVAAFFGAAIGLSYTPPMTKGKALVALFTGWCVAVYASPLFFALIEYYTKAELSKEVTGSISFFSGLIALRLVPVLLFHVEQLKHKTFPSGEK